MRNLVVIVMVTVVGAACFGSDGSDSTRPSTAPRAADTTAAVPTSSTAPPAIRGLGTLPRGGTSSSSSAAPSTSTTTTTTAGPAVTAGPAATSAPALPTTTTPNQAPTVSISAPAGAKRYEAAWDPAEQRFGATVQLTASAFDPDGDPVTLEWYSSDEGFLGTGASIAVRLHPVGDASQPTITVVVRDGRGAVAEDSRQVIVWIPSDQ